MSHPTTRRARWRPIVVAILCLSTLAACTPEEIALFRANYRPPTGPPAGVWDRLAKCESGGNWSINTGNGYYGGLQFDLRTWRGNGGSGYPHQNSRAEQIRVAERVRAGRGFAPWPACSRRLGLR